MKWFRIALILVFLVITASFILGAEKLYSYNLHILPINSENCQSCHCSGYRFLCNYENMMEYISETRESTKGIPLVVPGKPDSSVVIWRLEGRLPNGEEIDSMPQNNDKLSEEKRQIYREWIEQGAVKSIVGVDDKKKWGQIKKMFR